MPKLSAFLSQVEWTFTYGVFQGTVEDSPEAKSVLGKDSSGTLEVASGASSGSQETIIEWYTDENLVKLRVLSISEPKK